MSILISDLTDQCCTAVMENSKMQEQIRDFIDLHKLEGRSNEAIAEVVAQVCTDFRAKIEPWLNTEGADRKARSKRVNNVINDISRISRTLLDSSIVCVTRKGGHVYAPATPKPRATGGSVSAPTEDPLIETLRNRVDELLLLIEGKDKILSSPSSCVDHLAESYSLEYIARVVLEKLKQEEAM
jgi:hypothetical protein